MAQKPTIEVVGLRALSRDLKKMSDEKSGPIVDAMKKAGKAAAEPVAAATRSSLPSVSGRLAGNVRTSGTRTGAAVRMGSRGIPYAGWIEFGGSRGGRNSRGSRPFTAGGRYLFPAAEAHASDGARIYEEEVTKALDHFNWTNATTSAGSVHD
jgi:hypothetical protein